MIYKQIRTLSRPLTYKLVFQSLRREYKIKIFALTQTGLGVKISLLDPIKKRSSSLVSALACSGGGPGLDPCLRRGNFGVRTRFHLYHLQ